MEDNEKYEEEYEEEYVNNVLKCPFSGCIIAEEGNLDSIDSCGHLAFFGAWGYEKFDREKRKWSKELTKIIRNLGNEDYTRMEKLQDVILSPSSHRDDWLTKSIQSIISDDIEFAINRMDIECGMGEHGGGPTFIGLFMKKKTT